MTRIIEGIGGGVRTETVVVVTMVDDGGLFDKEWFWTDKVIQNSQGGTTHLNGWHIS